MYRMNFSDGGISFTSGSSGLSIGDTVSSFISYCVTVAVFFWGKIFNS